MPTQTFPQTNVQFIKPARAPKMDEATVLAAEPADGKYVLEGAGGDDEFFALSAADVELYSALRVAGRHRVMCVQVNKSTYVTCRKQRLLLEPGFHFVDGVKVPT